MSFGSALRKFNPLGLFDLATKKPKFNTKGDIARLRQARKIYNPFDDKPLEYEDATGAVRFQPDGKNSLDYNAKVSSPLIAKNTKTQLSLANQGAQIARDTRNIVNDPNSSRIYRAFSGQLNQAFDQLRGQQAARQADSQSSALGRILGNKAMYQVANIKAAQPYTFLSEIAQPLIQQTAQSQAGLQTVNTSVNNNLLNNFSTLQGVQDDITARRQNEARQRFNFAIDQRDQRLNRADARRGAAIKTLGTIAGGVGGFFLGGPAGAMAGASLGGQLGGSIAGVAAPRASYQMDSAQAGKDFGSLLDAYKERKAAREAKNPSGLVQQIDYSDVFNQPLKLPSASRYSGFNAGVN